MRLSLDIQERSGLKVGKGEIGLPKLVLLGMTQYFSHKEKSTAGNWENVGRLYDHHKNRSRFYTKNKSRNFAVKLSTCAKKSTRVFFQERIVTTDCTSQEEHCGR